MWSYPNTIPLSSGTVRRVADALKPWRVDHVYGFSVGRQILENGSAAIEESAQRYIQLLSEDHYGAWLSVRARLPDRESA